MVCGRNTNFKKDNLHIKCLSVHETNIYQQTYILQLETS
jgi:hypothetical protein